MLAFAIRRLGQSALRPGGDVVPRVPRRVRDRQSDRAAGQSPGRRGRARARHRGARPRQADPRAVRATFLARARAATSAARSCYNVPAIQLILDKLPATLELALAAMVIAIAIGIPLGLVAGLKPAFVRRAQRSWPVRSSASACRRSGSGLVLIMVFSVHLRLAAAERPRRDRVAARRAGELPHARTASSTSRCRR